MYFTIHIIILLSMWFLCRVTAVRRGDFRTGEHQDDMNTIRLYLNYSVSRNFKYSECMPEKTNYKMMPHQDVTVDIISPRDAGYVFNCKWNGGVSYYTNNSMAVDLTWNKDTIILPDIGEKSGDLQCFTLLDLESCQVHISIDDGVDNYVQYNRSFAYLNLVITSAQNNTEMQIYYAENTSLAVHCVFDLVVNNDYYIKIQRLYKNGSDIIVEEKNSYVYFYDFNFHLNKDFFNDNVISFVRRNGNGSISLSLRLKYREDWRVTAKLQGVPMPWVPVLLTMFLPFICMMVVTGSLYYWRQRGQKKTSPLGGSSRSDSHEYQEIPVAAFGEESAALSGLATAELRSGSLVSNDYEEVYDVMYEERLRIERQQKQWQQAKDSPLPLLPPVETIPLREPQPLAPRVHQLPTPNSAISPADLYLLKIDSDGYEIPDECKFIPLLRSDDAEHVGINHIQMDSQEVRDGSRRLLAPPRETISHRLPLASLSIHQLPPDSAISPEDVYLLKLDSDGYEIPDELKFIPLPNRCDKTT